MDDQNKNKAQLIDELRDLRQQVARLGTTVPKAQWREGRARPDLQGATKTDGIGPCGREDPQGLSVPQERTAFLDPPERLLRVALCADPPPEHGSPHGTLGTRSDFFHTVFADANNPVYIVNVDDYRVELANPAARSRGMFAGSLCFSVAHKRTTPCDGSGHLCPLRTIKESRQAVMLEHVHSCGDGRQRPFEIRAWPILDNRGNVSHVVNSCVDIADRQQAQAAMIQKEKSAAVADLTAGVEHNFNNLLQAIMSTAQLALMDLELEEWAEIKESLDRIIMASRTGAAIVKRLSYLTQAAEAAPQSNTVVVDASHVVRRARDMAAPWWKDRPKEKGIAIDLSLNLTENCFVSAPQNDLCQVISNLLLNAIEALPQGGQVRLSTGLDEESVIIKIEDSGLGIPSKFIPRLFSPFFSTKEKCGTGLGLASCHTIVNRYGGRILVESVEGAGSVFTIHWPRAKGVDRTKTVHMP